MIVAKNKILFLVIGLGALLYCLLEAQGRGDLLIFLTAAGDLKTHADIFTKDYYGGYHYYYSVLFAIVIQPFYYLPFYGVKFCWLILNLVLFLHLFYMLSVSGFVNALTGKQKNIFLMLVFIYSLRFVHENLHTSQITILILWCSIYGLCLISHKKLIKGSFLLAAGINIKLLPLLFLPYLLYRGYFKAFFLTILFYAATLIIPSFIIGHDYNSYLLQNWFRLINPMNTQHIMDVDERSFHGITTLLTTLFIENPPDPLALRIKRNITDVSIETLATIILFARGVLVCLTLYFLELKTVFKKTTSTSGVLEISYILLLIPLIFPHQQHYAFLFTIPAYSVILYYLVKDYHSLKKSSRIPLTVSLIVIFLLTAAKLILGGFNRYYEHYKILTYGALLIIPLLLWCKRNENRLKILDERNVPVT